MYKYISFQAACLRVRVEILTRLRRKGVFHFAFRVVSFSNGIRIYEGCGDCDRAEGLNFINDSNCVTCRVSRRHG